MPDTPIWDRKSEYSQEGKIIRTTSGAAQTPGRWVVENGTRRWYTGDGLVTADGRILRTETGNTYYYDVQSDPGIYLAAMSPGQRVAFMNVLADAGMISRNSIGDYNAELSAMSQALQLGNDSGLEWSYAIQKRLANGPVMRQGGGQRTYQTSSADDLKKIAKKVAQDTLGRELTDAEAAQFAQTYQQQEIQYQRKAAGGGTVQAIPSADVAAETFAQQVDPQQAAGYKYLGYMNKLFNAVGVQ